MTHLDQPLSIGNLTLSNRAILAPLAGVSDVPFRRVCRAFSASLSFVEMLSATAILHKSRRTYRMMDRHPDEDLLGVQVTGDTPEVVGDAVRLLDQHDFDIIDLNMGCPVRKIVAKGWGSAITKDPQLVYDMVVEARKATSKPLSVKCRIGYSLKHVNIDDVSCMVRDAGADALTVHGRTRDDDYSVPVRFDTIKTAVENSGSMTTIGNGDVMDLESARNMVQRTGCDAVMVSRGALGNPWIFREIAGGRPVHPTVEEWLETTFMHLAYHEEYYGSDRMSAILMRKHLLWYCNGFPGCRRLRDQLSTVESLEYARSVLKQHALLLPSDLARNEPYDMGDASAHTFDPKYDMHRKHDKAVVDTAQANR